MANPEETQQARTFNEWWGVNNGSHLPAHREDAALAAWNFVTKLTQARIAELEAIEKAARELWLMCEHTPYDCLNEYHDDPDRFCAVCKLNTALARPGGKE